MVIDHVLVRMAGPFVWGRADCCTSACDVFAALYGVDPMAPLRGRYSGRAGAMRIIARAGGFDALAVGLAMRAGLARSDWRLGALGVAEMPDGPALVVGLDQPGWWAGKCDGGHAVTDQVRMAWRKP